MNDLKTVTSVVKEILTQYKQTRSCDGLLYLKVLEYYSHKKGIDLRMLSVPLFLQQMGEMGFPGHETVRRTRQKLQATYPELAACEAVESFRAQNEREFRAYARSEV
jgi:hypothetical protein